MGYIISYFIPRDDKIAVFGYSNGELFTDNSKYLYMYAEKELADVRPVWLTRDEKTLKELRSNGYESYGFKSLRGIWISLRSSQFFITHTRKDVPWWCTGGSTVVRLNHGIPFKRFGKANRITSLDIMRRISRKYLFTKYDASISTSKEYTGLISEATGVPEEKITITGLPRMDIFKRDIDDVQIGTDSDMMEEIKHLSRDKDILFYFPTWRRGDGSSMPSGINMNRLNRVLKESDSVLFIREHILSDGIEIQQHSNIRKMKSGRDFYPILSHTDLFITDYSSLFYDAIYADIPTVFFPHDFDEYAKRRGFFFDYRDVPGRIIWEVDDFVDELEEEINGKETHESEREQWREKAFRYCDGANCRRVAETYLK